MPDVRLARGVGVGVAVAGTASVELVAVGTGSARLGSVTSVLLQAVPPTATRKVARTARSRVGRRACVRARIMLEYPWSKESVGDTRGRRGARARHGRSGGSSSEGPDAQRS